MDSYYIIIYALKALTIIASALGFFIALAFTPQLKELLKKKPDKNRNMWRLVLLLPVVFLLLDGLTRSFRIHLPVPFDPILLVFILWVLGMYFGTRVILASDIQENTIRLGKFVAIYTLTNIVLMMVHTFLYMTIFAVN